MVEDAQGRHWMLGVESGEWHVYNEGAWIKADPYATQAQAIPTLPTDLPELGTRRGSVAPSPPAAPQSLSSAPPPVLPLSQEQPATAPAPAKSGMGCGGCLVRGCLVLVVLLVLIGGGGFLAFQSGFLTLNRVLTLIGQGPSTIQVNNFRDDPIQVTITPLQESSESSSLPSTLDLNPFDVKTYHSTNPLRLRVDFLTAETDSPLASCTLNVRGNDEYQFVALPERIVVNRVNNPPTVGSDLIVEQSSLCR